jgi:hypothetical protein
VIEEYKNYAVNIKEPSPWVDSSFSTFYIRMDNKEKTVERNVRGLLEILGTIGGLSEIAIACIGTMYGVISQQAFIGTLVRKFYLVRNRPNLTDQRHNRRELQDPDKCHCFKARDFFFSIFWCFSSSKSYLKR